ncbi:NFKBIZ [Acanthosepion pharaonis]|uniref:NFKBIZ n=1 Tax=Acanthosepion pharaonis TaxID=158019 RepID=A0A812BXQ9_ACAPH|nr:NFKBIZ [Sepia pharaonis]
MPLDYDDLETDNSDGEKKVFEGESSVDLDYKSNIELAKTTLNVNVQDDKMLQEKTTEDSSASPDNNDNYFREISFDNFHFIKKETSNEDCQFDENKLEDVCEIIEKDLNTSRIKEEKERLEKALRDDSFSASSPPQHVPQQGSIPSSSPPSLYNPELNDILGNLLKPDITLPPRPTHNQPQFLPQQPPITTCPQPHQPILVNSNHHQFTQQQEQQQPPPPPPPQAQIVTSSSHIPYSLPPQQANVLSNAPTQQQYPVQQISTTGNQHQYVVPEPPIYSHSQQPVQSSSLLGYNQQNQQSANSTASNQHFTSQQQTQMIQSSKPYSVALQPVASSQQHFPLAQQTQVTNQTHYAVQPQQQSQIITSTSNQHYMLSQHQSLATPKQQFANSPHQQRVTASQSHVTGCAIQPPQPAIQQLTPGLPVTTASDQDVNATPPTSSNNAVIILAQPANSPNSIMLVPTTNSPLIYIPQIPVTTKNKTVRSTPRVILPKPANSEPNGNPVDLKKLSAQTGKGRREKEKSSQPSESPGQGNLSVARRCVAGMKEDDLENTDQEGDNYLHVAVCRTDVYMVEALLERLNRSSKLDMINRQNHAQQTPVYLAVSANQPAMVHKLIRYGADVNIKGMMQGYQHERLERAPIHCAASQGKEYYDTLKELFTSPVIDPDILNSDGLSALHCAIIEHGKLVPNQKFQMTKIDNCQNVALLLKNKANPNLQDRCSGKTPLIPGESCTTFSQMLINFIILEEMVLIQWKEAISLSQVLKQMLKHCLVILSCR